jgi:hypothetical protein
MRLALHWFRKKIAARFDVPASVPIPPPQTPAFQRPVSRKLLPVKIAEVQKRICIFPPRLNKMTSWIPADAIRQGITVAVTGIPNTVLRAFVAVSWITCSVHLISDVLMGGAPGYSLSRFAVLRL